MSVLIRFDCIEKQYIIGLNLGKKLELQIHSL